MPKEVMAVVKVQLQAGAATPAPPLGPALGQHGVNIMQFVKDYNAKTAAMAGQVIPAEITVFNDRSFTFITKTPPASELLKKAAGVEKGSGDTPREKAGVIARGKVKEIAELKMKDLNAISIEGAMRIIEGTARSMGLDVKD